MSEMIQPDLFGEFEAAEAEAAQRRERLAWHYLPAICPSCGTTEPNGFLLRNNHGYDVERAEGEGICGFAMGLHPIYGDRCIAQELTRNHVISAVRSGDAAELAERVKRARELKLDVDALIEACRAI